MTLEKLLNIKSTDNFVVVVQLPTTVKKIENVEIKPDPEVATENLVKLRSHFEPEIKIEEKDEEDSDVEFIKTCRATHGDNFESIGPSNKRSKLPDHQKKRQPASKIIHQCDSCQASFSGRKTLENHKKSKHLNKRIFKCGNILANNVMQIMNLDIVKF